MHRKLLAVALTLSLTPFALANHTQTQDDKTLIFDHKTGNDWWVEVVLTGPDAASVTQVEAQMDFDRWHTLPKRSWGAYGASFHIYQDLVRFRATWADGSQMVSCFFTHPEGAERCASPAVTPGWRDRLIGDSGSESRETALAMADADRDGRNELYVAAGEGFFQHERGDDGAWHRTTVMADPPNFHEHTFQHVTVGDVHSDGVLEVYSVAFAYNDTSSGDHLYWHHWNGEVWFTEEIAFFRPGVTAMVVADVEDDGEPELYVATGYGSDSTLNRVFRIDHERIFFRWSVRMVANLPSPADGLAAGDADRDGDIDLWANLGGPDRVDIWRIDGAGDTWGSSLVTSSTYGENGPGILVGDGDNDGKEEIYTVAGGFDRNMALLRFSPRELGWNEVRLDLGPGVPMDLALGDGDNDAKGEIYVSEGTGRLLQARWTGSVWAAAAILQVGSGDALTDLVVGDADSDGRSEVYANSDHVGVCCKPILLHQIVRDAASAFDAAFSGVKGNEWWIQAFVSASGGTVASVDARLDGSTTWRPLAKQSWGAWAASFRMPQGTVVELRAVSTTGEVDRFHCYQWIPPQDQEAPRAECVPEGTARAFDATFSGVKGNEWWVQTNVAANEPLAGVDARVNCGSTWKPLAKQSWGGWAASFHVPSGSKVDFRARSTSGAQDLSGGYIWPEATPASAC